MSRTKLFIAAISTAALLYTPLSQAESLVDGTYQSEGDSNGTGKCTLIIKSITESRKYGDESFELESSGDGACEWSAIGLSKSYAITGGMVTSGGAPAFVKLAFPFGPAGSRLEMTAYDLDGSIRVNEVFAKK
ncbi:MAG: hypothetical protein HOF74_04750 [Gammaproteobacteria bacterium]|jgi:hypothetical protein|nr:hypothetical protein [Gammaproteobacteria bacterium]MBT3859118.1 hypothetical protein [Gammaproteobacteria bacterium]MBT3987118.1 hypothetical protein [Gammaproteobacteria bacterium]MBT4255698.1 hypothetical protein [Gammaproteobacteria bacterium]MBT4580537.1 hypothetical protein [Gammaproteobacteria bacterium]